MISPGEGFDLYDERDQVQLDGMDIGVGVGRCANVTNYMCCRERTAN